MLEKRSFFLTPGSQSEGRLAMARAVLAAGTGQTTFTSDGRAASGPPPALGLNC